MSIRITRIFGGLILAICMMLNALAVNADELWASSSSGSNPASIYLVDSDTGVATLVGPIGLTDSIGRPNKVSAVALDPMTGTLYGIWGSACSGAKLITIDKATGAGTVVGPLVGMGFDGSDDTGRDNSNPDGPPCTSGSDALMFGDDGTLYAGGWQATGSFGVLLTVDKTSGAVLSSLPTDAGAHIAGLAKAPDGALWVSRGNNAPGNMHTINPVTGNFASTLLLSDTTAGISDIAFAGDGTLYGSNPSAGMLATIDTGAGAITNIGAFGSGAKISGLTPRAATVPLVTCTDPDGCNPLGILNIQVPDSIVIPEGTVITQTLVGETDPRVAAGTCGQEPLILYADDPDKPDLIIPEHICGDPFIVVRTETDFAVENETIVFTNEPDDFFENPRSCNDPIPAGADPQSQDAVVQQATDGDPRGDGFATDRTFECGSSRGRSRTFSYNVIGMSIDFGIDWETDPDGVWQAYVDLGHAKYHRLSQAALNSAEALPYQQWGELVAWTECAKYFYSVGYYELANRSLERVLRKVEEYNFDSSVGFNHAGFITTKADNLRFYTDQYVINLGY